MATTKDHLAYICPKCGNEAWEDVAFWKCNNCNWLYHTEELNQVLIVNGRRVPTWRRALKLGT